MAIAGGAVPTIRLELRLEVGRLKVGNNGSMGRESAMDDVGAICDQLLAGAVVYANATGDRLRLVDAELQRRNVWIDVWPW